MVGKKRRRRDYEGDEGVKDHPVSDSQPKHDKTKEKGYLSNQLGTKKTISQLKGEQHKAKRSNENEEITEKAQDTGIKSINKTSKKGSFKEKSKQEKLKLLEKLHPF